VIVEVEIGSVPNVLDLITGEVVAIAAPSLNCPLLRRGWRITRLEGGLGMAWVYFRRIEIDIEAVLRARRSVSESEDGVRA